MSYFKKKFRRSNPAFSPTNSAPRSFPDDSKFDSSMDSSPIPSSASLSHSSGADTNPPPAYEYVPVTPPVPTVKHETFSDTSPDTAQYSQLKKFDTVFLIDDSGSMVGPNWEQTASALAAVVPICTAQDSDGVDIHFLNHNQSHTNIRNANQLQSIFASVIPRGTTPTGSRLGFILDAYLARYRGDREIKPLNVIVITDGAPTDPSRLERNIIKCAKELDTLRANERQVGIQFFQVGSDDDATESLDELDNALVERHHIRDMVDTVSWKDMNNGQGLTADGILKAVMGAIDKRLDRKRC